MQLTLWRHLGFPIAQPRLPPGLAEVTLNGVSMDAFGDLFSVSYEPPHRTESRAAARSEMVATLDGTYGDLMAASVAVVRDGKPIAVIRTVLRTPWPDVRDGPFVIELFTSPDGRRCGLARSLLSRSVAAARGVGEAWIGLRVGSDNDPAPSLHRSAGFVEPNQ